MQKQDAELCQGARRGREEKEEDLNMQNARGLGHSERGAWARGPTPLHRAARLLLLFDLPRCHVRGGRVWLAVEAKITHIISDFFLFIEVLKSYSPR